MKAAILLAAIPALSLSACGGGSAPPSEQNDAAAMNATGPDGLNYQAEVASLPMGQRNGVFIRALRDGGLECQGVTASIPAEDMGAGAWRVRCTDNRAHLIKIAPDGNASILSSAK